MLEEKAKLDLDSMVTVVVPTLNEEEAIARVIQELGSVGLRNIMVVDGYSRDKTVDIAENSGATVLLQQGKGGDKHVYAIRSRFLPTSVLGKFDQTSWAPGEGAGASRAAGPLPKIDLAAKARGRFS